MQSGPPQAGTLTTGRSPLGIPSSKSTIQPDPESPMKNMNHLAIRRGPSTRITHYTLLAMKPECFLPDQKLSTAVKSSTAPHQQIPVRLAIPRGPRDQETPLIVSKFTCKPYCVCLSLPEGFNSPNFCWKPLPQLLLETPSPTGTGKHRT